jgi:hypothetical protein
VETLIQLAVMTSYSAIVVVAGLAATSVVNARSRRPKTKQPSPVVRSGWMTPASILERRPIHTTKG